MMLYNGWKLHRNVKRKFAIVPKFWDDAKKKKLIIDTYTLIMTEMLQERWKGVCFLQHTHEVKVFGNLQNAV